MAPKASGAISPIPRSSLRSLVPQTIPTRGAHTTEMGVSVSRSRSQIRYTLQTSFGHQGAAQIRTGSVPAFRSRRKVSMLVFQSSARHPSWAFSQSAGGGPAIVHSTSRRLLQSSAPDRSPMSKASISSATSAELPSSSFPDHTQVSCRGGSRSSGGVPLE